MEKTGQYYNSNLNNNQNLKSNSKTESKLKKRNDSEYVQFPQSFLILWIVVFVFTLILTIFSIMMLIFDIALQDVTQIYTSTVETTYEGYLISDLITPEQSIYINTGYQFIGGESGSDYVTYTFTYNDSRIPNTGSFYLTNPNQRFAISILMFYPDLYLSAAGYPVSNGPGTYGYEFANLFYTWLKYADSSNNIHHSAALDSSVSSTGDDILLSYNGNWQNNVSNAVWDSTWQGDSIYSIFALSAVSSPSVGPGTTFYVWNVPILYDFWYQDWWNSDYFEIFRFGNHIDSLTDMQTNILTFLQFNFGSTNLSDHAIIVFQVDSTANPSSDSATTLIPVSGSYTILSTIDEKSVGLSITQFLLLFFALLLVILVFTPFYRKSRKTFTLFNIIIPIILIIGLILTTINYAMWIELNNKFSETDLDVNVTTYISTKPPLNTNVNGFEENGFGFGENTYLNFDVLAYPFLNDSYTFQSTNLVHNGKIVPAVSFEFAFSAGTHSRYLNDLAIIQNLMFLNYSTGKTIIYIFEFLTIGILLLIFIYSFFFKSIKLVLHQNEIKTIVDKKINEINKTTEKINKTKEKYDK